MPRLDFTSISDSNDYPLLPDGDYVCEITDIEPSHTKAGDDMWKLRLTVQEGEYADRLIFDNLAFTPRALSRVKLVCKVCGIDTSGAIDLDPSMLLDKRVLVSTYTEEYTDSQRRKKFMNAVPFDGYKVAPADRAGSPF